MQGPAKLEIGSLTTVYVLTWSQFKFKTHWGRDWRRASIPGVCPRGGGRGKTKYGHFLKRRPVIYFQIHPEFVIKISWVQAQAVLVNKTVWEHSHTLLLTSLWQLSHDKLVVLWWSCGDRDRMAGKAQNICYLDLYRGSLPIPSLENIWKYVCVFGLSQWLSRGRDWHLLGIVNFHAGKTTLPDPVIATPLRNLLSK